MKFFDERGNPIQCQEWLKTYESYYFLNGPTWRRRITRANQSSRFVEDEVCSLLGKKTPLTGPDLILVMAWKIGGLIHHGRSEKSRRIEYEQGWPKTLLARGRYGTRNFSESIPSLASNMATILRELDRGNPRYLFDLVPKLPGFGPVYILSVLFFVSHGSYPIYDRYAHIAALAIHQDLPPGSVIRYKALQKWDEYEAYMSLLLPISKGCPAEGGETHMVISRPADRALWAYGHFFRTPGEHGARAPRCSSQAPMRDADVEGVLIGRIFDLSNYTSDGWRRREIHVKKGPEGYPTVRDLIHLVDSSGTKHVGLPFIKGASDTGHTCLGKPGKLKAWFERHYPKPTVESANVYFEPTGQPNEYRLYTESEWKKKQVPHG